MRAAIAAISLALVGCAFDPRGAGATDPDAPVDDGDGPAPVVDAPNGSIDAPAPSIDAAPCGDLDRDGICDTEDTWDCGAVRPTVAFPATDNTGRVNNTAIGFLGSPVEQLMPGEMTAISVDVGSNEGGAYRFGEAGGRYFGCRNGNDNVLGWINPVTFTASSSITGQPIALVYQHTSSCGAGWAGGAPTSPVIGYYCVRLQ